MQQPYKKAKLPVNTKKLLNRIVIALLFNTISLSLFGQCFSQNFSFKEGELLKYQAYYNWGFVWLNAGYVDFAVKAKTFQNQPVYYLDAYGASHNSYDWIFKVRDRFQCYLSKETLQPLWFHRHNSEGGYEVDNQYSFDYTKKKVFTSTENSDQPLKRDTLELKRCTFDLLSMVYYCRNLNFNSLQIGDSLPVTTLIDTEYYQLYIRYLGRETITTKNDKQYKCIKFSALLVEGTIFKGGENMLVWVTDDKNRIPVLVEAKILIGSVKAYLESMEGLRNSVTSQVP